MRPSSVKAYSSNPMEFFSYKSCWKLLQLQYVIRHGSHKELHINASSERFNSYFYPILIFSLPLKKLLIENKEFVFLFKKSSSPWILAVSIGKAITTEWTMLDLKRFYITFHPISSIALYWLTLRFSWLNRPIHIDNSSNPASGNHRVWQSCNHCCKCQKSIFLLLEKLVGFPNLPPRHKAKNVLLQ